MPVSRSAFLRAVAGVEESGFAKVQSLTSALSSPPESKHDVDDKDAIGRGELPLPVVLVPRKADDATLEQTTEWVRGCQPHLESLLAMSGALLFRSFPTPLAADFADFIDAFAGWKDLPYEDSLSYAVRLRVCRRVCTTNEGKTGGLIFHHELAQAPTFPSKLLFFCEQPADEGGATAVTPSWLVLDELKQRFPAFVAQCKEKQLRYHSVFPAEPDTSRGTGRSWKMFFGRETREAVQQRMAELGYTGSWDEQDCLHLSTPVLPAISLSSDGTEVFFNQMIAQAISNAREFNSVGAGAEGRAVKLEQFLTFGDGSPVDEAALRFAHAVSERAAVELQWQKGDIGLIDNKLLMHARRSFEGPRRVFASLVM